MEKVVIILSHKLSIIQLQEIARNDWEPVYLPEELQKETSNIDPELTSNEVYELAERIYRFCIKNGIKKGIIAGELTLVSHMLKISGEREYGSILMMNWFAATSKRISKDVVNNDGTTTKTSVFEHVQFRHLAN